MGRSYPLIESFNFLHWPHVLSVLPYKQHFQSEKFLFSFCGTWPAPWRAGLGAPHRIAELWLLRSVTAVGLASSRFYFRIAAAISVAAIARVACVAIMAPSSPCRAEYLGGGLGAKLKYITAQKGAPISMPWRALSLNPPGAVTVRPGWEREPEATEFKVKKVFCESRLTWFRRVGGSRRKTRPTGFRSACRRGPQTACKTTKQPNNHPNAIAQQGHRSARNDGYHRPEQTAAHHGARV